MGYCVSGRVCQTETETFRGLGLGVSAASGSGFGLAEESWKPGDGSATAFKRTESRIHSPMDNPTHVVTWKADPLFSKTPPPPPSFTVSVLAGGVAGRDWKIMPCNAGCKTLRGPVPKNICMDPKV